MPVQDHYRHITAPEAQATLGIPAATLRSWVHRHRLLPVGDERDGTRRMRYRLADVLALAAQYRPRG